MSRLRPQNNKRYSRDDIDALFRHLPDEPFRTKALTAAVRATGLWQGRGDPCIVAASIRIGLLLTGELVVARRETPRKVWLVKGTRRKWEAPRQTVGVYLTFARTGTPDQIRRSVRIPLEPQVTVDGVLERLRPLIGDVVDRYLVPACVTRCVTHAARGE